ncbi:MAG: DUF1801 domain-containing protein [Opitutus sp.]|nr:DUF1801 domain-containing protein [Opitutus sp.]
MKPTGPRRSPRARSIQQVQKLVHAATPKSPQVEIAGFIAKFTPEIATLTRALRAKMRQRLPDAVEMVYDNYNFLVFGFGPTERPSEAIFSIAAYARGVGLCFIHGAKLPDPKKLLQGSGKQTRFLKLPTDATLDEPAVQRLIASAIAHAPVPFDRTARRRLIIKSISAKQRPRRPV